MSSRIFQRGIVTVTATDVAGRVVVQAFVMVIKDFLWWMMAQRRGEERKDRSER
jgi:hypothetical protein